MQVCRKFPCSWCNQVLWSPQMVRKNTSRRWDLWLEVTPPIGGGTSNQRWDLQLEVSPLIGGEASDWRWDLWLEVGPLIGGGLCMWGQTGAPMLHVGISYSFAKKRLFIVDYIKPCKLVKNGSVWDNVL